VRQGVLMATNMSLVPTSASSEGEAGASILVK
jgi:hypothetical protein